MLTILNIINYFTGRPLPFYILILITIAIYYYVISYYWDTIASSNIYLITILILLLIDITAIIMIYTIYHDNNENSDSCKIKKNKKDKKSKKNKRDAKLEIKNTVVENILEEKIKDVEQETNNNNGLLNNEKEVISMLSLYDAEKDVSLHTY